MDDLLTTNLSSTYLGSTLASGSVPERLFLRLTPDFSDGISSLQVLLNSTLFDVQGTHSDTCLLAKRTNKRKKKKTNKNHTHRHTSKQAKQANQPASKRGANRRKPDSQSTDEEMLILSYLLRQEKTNKQKNTIAPYLG